MPADNAKHVLALDGLRGVAVLLVILSHFSNDGYHILWVDFSGIGKCGVFLFFVLSAFLLTAQFLDKGLAQAFKPYQIANYFWRRTLRVLPLYYLVLIVSVLTTLFLSQYLLGHGLPYTISTEEFLPHVLLQDGKSVLWSIPVEFKYYFVLPLVSLVFLVTGRKRFYLDVLFIAACIALVHLLYPPHALAGGTVRLGFFLPIFLLGSLCAAAVYKLPRERLAGLRLGWLAYLTGAAVIVSIPSIYSVLIEPVEPGFLHKAFILYGLLWSGFLFGVLNTKSWLNRLFCARWLTFVGHISFSVYLLHMPILEITNKLAPGNLFAAWLAVGVIVLVSYLSVRIIERPLSRIQLKDARRLLRPGDYSASTSQ